MPDQSIEVRLNGKPRQIPEGLTLRGLLDHLQVKHDRVAIELNREIVKAEIWESTRIQAGDELEVVHFVGGGACSTTDSSPVPSAALLVLKPLRTVSYGSVLNLDSPAASSTI